MGWGILVDLYRSFGNVDLEFVTLVLWVLQKVFVHLDILLHVVNDLGKWVKNRNYLYFLIEGNNCGFQMFDLNFLFGKASH